MGLLGLPWVLAGLGLLWPVVSGAPVALVAKAFIALMGPEAPSGLGALGHRARIGFFRGVSSRVGSPWAHLGVFSAVSKAPLGALGSLEGHRVHWNSGGLPRALGGFRVLGSRGPRVTGG